MIKINTKLKNVKDHLPSKPRGSGNDWSIQVLARIKKKVVSPEHGTKPVIIHAVGNYVKRKGEPGEFIIPAEFSGEITHWMRIPQVGEVEESGYKHIIKRYNFILYGFRNIINPKQAYLIKRENTMLKDLQKAGIFKKPEKDAFH